MRTRFQKKGGEFFGVAASLGGKWGEGVSEQDQILIEAVLLFYESGVCYCGKGDCNVQLFFNNA